MRRQSFLDSCLRGLSETLGNGMQALGSARAREDQAALVSLSGELRRTLGEIHSTSPAYLANLLERAAGDADWLVFDMVFSVLAHDVVTLRQEIHELLGSEPRLVSAADLDGDTGL